MKIKHLLLPLVIPALTACQDDNFAPNISTEGTMPIEIGAEYPLLSRASENGFDFGDRIGVYVAQYAGDNAVSLASPDIYAKNISYTLQESTAQWTGSTNLYWDDIKGGADIVGYYPFVEVIDNPENMSVSVSQRQDAPATATTLSGYEASDFMRAAVQKAMPTQGRVNLMFKHLMAGVRITLQPGTGFTDADWSTVQKHITISNTIKDAVVNLQTGTVNTTGNAAPEITPCVYGNDYRAVVVPQTVDAGKRLLNITIDGKSYTFSRNESITFAQGKLHSFTIKVERKADSGDYALTLVDEAILPWVDDPDFHDGIQREYIIVKTKGEGTLQSVIESMGLKVAQIQNIKIVGEVNQDDINYLRGNASVLSAVNMKEMVMLRDHQPTYTCGSWEGKSTLRHVVFPDNLREIEACCFRACGLMGSLIIPDGVIKINDMAFCDNRALNGTITLPEGLEYIGGSAFCITALHGEIRFPSTLKHIGGGAFATDDGFTGTLSLPEDIEYLGGGFVNGNFTGNLVVSQNIKTIESGAFWDCRFTGGLELPENMIEIPSGLFRNCGFRGELKLPSNLKYIRNEAFLNNNFTRIIFPKTLNRIDPRAFESCRYLSSVELPEGLRRIPNHCFSDCNALEEIVLPSTVETIYGAAFTGCNHLKRIVVNNPEPPLCVDSEAPGEEHEYKYTEPFATVNKNDAVVEVPKGSEVAFRRANVWKTFSRIAAHSNFVCRPSHACALASGIEKDVIINCDGTWHVQSCPDWCSVYPASGTGKTNVVLSMKPMPKGDSSRTGTVVFAMDNDEFTTTCVVEQFAKYNENECITLQKATTGNGINLIFVGEAFDAKSIADGSYEQQVQEQMNAFFGVFPFSAYRDRFNVYMTMSMSQDTEINTVNTWGDTRFNIYYAGSVSNMCIDNTEDIYNYVKQNTPVTDNSVYNAQIVVSVNSDQYGGNTLWHDWGGAISMCCRGNDYPSDTRGILQHEAGGHGFGHLGDETIIFNKFAPSALKSAVRETQERGWYQNVSASGKMADVPWSSLIFNPEYSVEVDVFEGGMGYTRGIYRSEINSCMNYGIPYYNAISRIQIFKRIMEQSGEGFSMDKFFAVDTKDWGVTARSAMFVPEKSYCQGMHVAPRLIKKSMSKSRK